MKEPAFSKPFELKRKDFGEGFKWGVSTAAYQIEGAFNQDGKGASIWDTFTAEEGMVYNGEHGRVACDFYHRYKEDIDLMKGLNIPNFRFSLSWARIFPQGTGNINSRGLDFYNRLIDYCLEQAVTPWVTLYHWDLPEDLEKQGGWTNRDILAWFEEYAYCCAKSFGDRVENWMVLNEPMVFTGAGYFLGVHAPGRKGLKSFLPAAHHAVLCQAKGGNVLRESVPQSNIGTTFSCSQITPFSESSADLKAAVRADALLNRLFVEPSLGLGYPVKDLPVLRKMEEYTLAGDLAQSTFDFDFIGIQNYTREVIKYSCFVPYLRSKVIKATDRDVKTTLMDWEVYPPSIYHMIRQFNTYEGIKKLIITENGAAFEDELKNGRVRDTDRLNYLKDHIAQVHKARSEGMKAEGYFVWTFTDNFEWAEGYYPRFGLVYTDFKTQDRIVKASAQWYSEFLADED
ncbi:GH1 family beta-glucosidase [Poritiphilus flavus]|uniref:Beta-glucosidase n=1 Tax=Poritiphilus flavus TaxID=2697053 RepID=A0A6L9E7N4_9FLAO|nr:GH1 family beta-glucosidase [Poritiphilus flavus]NAS10573.1 beta-glucosidase [Poritiphilus flavus]